MIDIQFPGGRAIRINTDDPAAASQAAQKIFERDHPEEFAAWRRQNLGIGASARRGFSSAIDQYQSNLYSGVELAGEATNSDTLRNFGRSGRIQQQREAATAFPSALRTSFLDAEGPSDVARAATEAVVGSLPQTGGALAGALAGARLGGGLGATVGGPYGAAAGALIGGIGGGMLAGYVPTLGANAERQIEVDAAARRVPVAEGRITSPGAAAAAAVGQTALESLSDVATLGAARFLGRPAAEAAGTLGQRVFRGAVVGGTTEPPVEMGQQALERAQAGLPVTGPEATREYMEAGLGGLVAGAVTGGAARGAFGARPTPAQTEQPPAPEAPAEPPAPTFIGPQAPPLPEAPAPVTTFEEAIEAIRARPELAPQISNVQPEDVVNTVNALQQYLYGQDTAQTRSDHISNWLGYQNIQVDPTTEEVSGRAGQAAQVIPQIYEAVRDGRLSLEEGFQPADIANIATEPYGGDPTNREIGEVREALDTFVSEGYLMKLPGGTYTLAPRDVAAQRQRQVDLQLQRDQVAEAQRREEAQQQGAEVNQAAEQGAAADKFPGLTQLATQTEAPVAAPRPEARVAPEVETAAADPDAEQFTFKTAKGSSYTAFGDGSTTRVKAARPEHPGDSGPKPRSVRTIYTTRDAASALAVPADTNWRFVFGDGNVSLITERPDGQWGVAPSQREVPFQTQPAVDLHPLEFWRPENLGGREVFRGYHPGNAITELSRTAPPAKPTTEAKPAPKPTKKAKPLNEQLKENAAKAKEAKAATLAKAPAKMTEAERKAAITKILAEDEAPPPSPDTSRRALGEVISDAGMRDWMRRLDAGETEASPLPAPGASTPRPPLAGGRPQRPEPTPARLREIADLREARGDRENAESLRRSADEWERAEAFYLSQGIAQSTARASTPALTKALAEDEAPAPKPTKKAKAKPKLAAVPTMGGTRSAEEVAAAQAAFQQVVGQNGRLSFEERLDVDNLAADVQQAAQESGISGDISGYAQGDLAVLSLANSDMPLDQVAIHEGQHIAEFMGLYKPNEIAILNANADKIRSVIKARLPYISDVNALPLEEVRAYGVNARVVQKADFGPLINRIFDKFGQFTQRLGNFVRGRGFQSWQDVYDRFLGGEMGKRPAATPDGAAILFAAPAPSTPNNKYLDAQIGFLQTGFSSLSNIAKDRTAIRPSAGVMDQTRMRRQEGEGDLLSRLESAATLSPADLTTITRAWEASSKAGKLSPQAAQLAPNLRKVFDELVSSSQQAFNYVQEAMVIDKFMPNEGMPAAQRAKLEAMWARHSEKHLWDIPKAELQAASPDGWREMQVIEQKRNKFYMPMLANGTHFIAAYKKDTKGNRVGPPVKMAIYTPPNLIQRARGFANTADAARQNVINALKAQGLDPAKHYVMESGVQLTQNEEAYGIRQQGDFISNYLKDLHQLPAFQTPGAAREKLAQINRKLDKDMADRLFRQNEDILVAVTPENQADYVLDMVPTYLLGVSNIQARRYTQEAWTRSIKNLNPKDVKYLNELRDYATSPNVAFSNLRTLTFFSLLGGAFDSALLDAAQIVQTSAPMLSRDGGSTASPKYLLPAYIQVLAKANAIYKSGKPFATAMQEVGRNAAEKAAIAKAVRFEVFSPLNTTESRGQATAAAMGKVFKNGRQAADNINYVARLLATPKQVFEQANRASTFIAAYRLAVDNPDVIKRSNKYDNRQITTPYDYAVAKVNDTQYITTKEDRALFQRFTPAAEVVTQFMSFTVKTMELYVRHATMVLQGIKGQDLDLVKAGGLGVIRMARNLILLAGVWALPGADFLKEAIEKLTAFIWGSTQNLDADLNRALGGGQLGAFVTRGAAHSLGGLAISIRMKVDPLPFNDLAAMNATFLLGPSGSFIDNGVRSAQFFNQGDWVNGLASLPIMPRFMGNVIRGADFATSGEVRTPRGENIISAQQTEKMDRPQLATAGLMAMGFQTSEVANLRDAYSRNREVAKQTQSATISMNTELAGYLTASMEATRKGDSDESQRQINRLRERAAHFQKRNQEFLAEGRPDLVLNINFGTIQQRAQLDYFGRTSPEALRQMGNARQRLRMQEEYDLRVNPR